jgi:hypothetical protein
MMRHRGVDIAAIDGPTAEHASAAIYAELPYFHCRGENPST